MLAPLAPPTPAPQFCIGQPALGPCSAWTGTCGRPEAPDVAIRRERRGRSLAFSPDGISERDLSGDDKQELLGLIEDYRHELVPLILPLPLLKHHPSRYPVPEWVHQQVCLNPYAKELMLRSDV